MKQGKMFKPTKTRWVLLMLAVVGALTFACKKNQDGSASSDPTAAGIASGNGNGVPSGAHYDLNIIGMSHVKTDTIGMNGHVIFVPLTGTCKISLTQGPFEVIDGNGTDGKAAFQLPSADSANTGTTTYSVYARALGRPGGNSTIKLCGTDSLGTTYCSGDSAQFVSVSGKGNKFTNVTQELLYVYVYINGVLTRIPLFDSRLQNYLWSYDNNGLKLLQLRFYQVPTVVP